jgi:hypothetical protein
MGDAAMLFIVMLSVLTLLDIMLTELFIALCRRTRCCPDREHGLRPVESIE